MLGRTEGMSLSELQETVKDREAWGIAVWWGHRESDTTEWLSNNKIASLNKTLQIIYTGKGRFHQKKFDFAYWTNVRILHLTLYTVSRMHDHSIWHWERNLWSNKLACFRLALGKTMKMA